MLDDSKIDESDIAREIIYEGEDYVKVTFIF